MTICEFNLLSETKQFDATFNQATFIDFKVIGVIRFALYALDKFFIGVEYNNSTNEINNLKNFKTGYLLDKYSNLEI
jgi:hypothetical protein